MTNARSRRCLLAVPSVTDVVGAGGVAPRWGNYLRELKTNGWVVDLHTVDAADYEQRIPRVVHPFFPKTLTDAPSATWMFRLWRRFRAARPDVVIITDLFNDVNLALLCRAARVPLVYSLHTDGSKLPGGVPAAASASQMLTARLATRAATTSQSFAKVLEERGVVKKASDLAHYRPVPTADLANAAASLSSDEIRKERARLTGAADGGSVPVLGYVGRWSAEKRIKLLVDAARAANGAFSFVVVGDAADEAVARDVEAWHAPPFVVVRRGMRRRGPELAATYAALDYLVSASDFETFGNTCAEAAACGTPALVQHGPGFVDQVLSSPQWDETPAGVVASDRGALLDYAAPDAAATLLKAIAATAPLVDAPERVTAAATAASLEGSTISELLDEAARDRGPRRWLFRQVLFFLAIAIAAGLRFFVVGYASYLSLVCKISEIFEPCLPRLRQIFRPPARRVRWAGSIGWGCKLFRSNMDSLRFGVAEFKPLPFNLVPENPFEDYCDHEVVKLEGLRETAATMVLPPNVAARFRKEVNECKDRRDRQDAADGP